MTAELGPMLADLVEERRPEAERLGYALELSLPETRPRTPSSTCCAPPR